MQQSTHVTYPFQVGVLVATAGVYVGRALLAWRESVALMERYQSISDEEVREVKVLLKPALMEKNQQAGHHFTDSQVTVAGTLSLTI